MGQTGNANAVAQATTRTWRATRRKSGPISPNPTTVMRRKIGAGTVTSKADFSIRCESPEGIGPKANVPLVRQCLDVSSTRRMRQWLAGT
jgi:hypothetical protein